MNVARPPKRGNVRRYFDMVGALAPNDAAILATEMDEDLDTIYGHQIGTADLLDGAVTTPKVADNSITAAKLAVGAIAGGTIGTAQLADLSVTTAKVANAAVTNPKIADGAVNNAKIAPLSVFTNQLYDSSVTAAKIAAGSTIRQVVSAPIPPLLRLETMDRWLDVVTLQIATSGGWVVLLATAGWWGQGPANLPLGFGRAWHRGTQPLPGINDMPNVSHSFTFTGAGGTQDGVVLCPLPNVLGIDRPPGGVQVYRLLGRENQPGAFILTDSVSPGVAYAIELS